MSILVVKNTESLRLISTFFSELNTLYHQYCSEYREWLLSDEETVDDQKIDSDKNLRNFRSVGEK